MIARRIGRGGTAHRRGDLIGITRRLEHGPVLWALCGFRGASENGSRAAGSAAAQERDQAGGG